VESVAAKILLVRSEASALFVLVALENSRGCEEWEEEEASEERVEERECVEDGLLESLTKGQRLLRLEQGDFAAGKIVFFKARGDILSWLQMKS
jgi:hypothetical protein